MKTSIEKQCEWLKEHQDDIFKEEMAWCKEMLDKHPDKMGRLSYDEHLKIHEEMVKEMINDDLNGDTTYYIGETSECDEIIASEPQINLKPILEEIRNDLHKEHLIYLFIKNGTIIKKFKFNGGKRGVAPDIDELKIIEEAKDLKASIYFVHNHPLTSRAMPSEKDLMRFKAFSVTCNKEKVEIADIGVVSALDYYSYKQKAPH